MPNLNPNCCGGACTSKEGQVRVYPIGNGANLILCHSCWTHENNYNASRGGERYGFPLRNWDTAEVYENQ